MDKDAPGHPLTASVLDTLGIAYLELRQCSEAERSFKRALRVLDGGAKAPDLTAESVKNHLGETQLECGHPWDAERTFEELVQARTAEAAPNDVLLADALDALACAYATNHKIGQAEATLRRALQILQTSPQPEPERTALAMDDLGMILRTQKRYSEALGYAEKARTALIGAVPLARPVQITNLSLLASLYLLTGHLEDAETCARESVSRGEELYGPENPRLASLMATAADVLRKTNRKSEAKLMQKRAGEIRAQVARNNPDFRYTVNVKALR